jgi:outer membrane protein TolC
MNKHFQALAVAASLSFAIAAPAMLRAQAASAFQGSVTRGAASAQPLGLSLDDAIQRGLTTNLGVILSNAQAAQARGERLTQLQSLLPSVEFTAKDAVQQTDLPAQGLRLPGFPTIIGPFGFVDVRASLSWSLIDLPSLQNYLAARHNFAAAQLSVADARDMVVLAVGNAYLLAVADQSRVTSVEAQVKTAQRSLDEAVDNHQAGTAPMIDELRARVDFQSLQQQLIVAQNAFEKDKLSLARTIGLPLAQRLTLTETEPYSALDHMDANALIQEAERDRKDLAALVEQAAAAQDKRKAATEARLPSVKADADYGDIGTTFGHSHGTVDASASLSMPIFKEYGLRGQADVAQAQLDTAKAQLSDRKAQVEADVRDALLDIAAAEKQIEVARSTVDLANEELKEAQERYVNGVSDNLAVTEAQQSVAQADDQLVASVYRANVAKLSLARALGAGENYQKYVGGK